MRSQNGFGDLNGDDSKAAILPEGVTSGSSSRPTARLQFVREHRLHGTITGLQRIQTIDTARDGLDRLLISFKDAKVRAGVIWLCELVQAELGMLQISLLEWSPDFYDLVSVSLHTFERLPQVVRQSTAR